MITLKCVLGILSLNVRKARMHRFLTFQKVFLRHALLQREKSNLAIVDKNVISARPSLSGNVGLKMTLALRLDIVFKHLAHQALYRV